MQSFLQHWKEFSSSNCLQSTGLGTGRKKVLLGEEEFTKRCHAAKSEENNWCQAKHGVNRIATILQDDIPMQVKNTNFEGLRQSCLWGL